MERPDIELSPGELRGARAAVFVAAIATAAPGSCHPWTDRRLNAAHSRSHLTELRTSIRRNSNQPSDIRTADFLADSLTAQCFLAVTRNT